MKERVLVNCAFGEPYCSLQDLTRAACQKFSDAALMFFLGLPAGSPPHAENCYMFKAYSISAAILEGFRYIAWIDATFEPYASMEPFWKHLEEVGWYAAPQQQSKLGTWCSDAALALYGFDRETAMKIPLVWGGFFGFDVKNPIGREIQHRWLGLAKAGAFHGPHYNAPGEDTVPIGNKFRGHVSSDPRVEGHRHDEAALSAVLYQMGLIPVNKGFLLIESPDGFVGRHDKGERIELLAGR